MSLLQAMKDSLAMRMCFPRMYKLLLLGSFVPTSTAAVERGFSTMNLICTPRRSSLAQAQLHSLLLMNIEGPDMFDNETLEKLVNALRGAKKRNILL